MGLPKTTVNTLLDEARYFKPGSHDGLCGFYATINGIRYLQQASDHRFLIDDDHAFFDEAVECLNRVPGAGICLLKNDSQVGGIDQFQIRDLSVKLVERINLGVNVTLIGFDQPMSFLRRYSTLYTQGQPFVLIAAHRDGTHWVVVADWDQDTFRLIDDGIVRKIRLSATLMRSFASDSAVLLTLRS